MKVLLNEFGTNMYIVIKIGLEIIFINGFQFGYHPFISLSGSSCKGDSRALL